MITYEDQMNLFGLISKKISKDVECYAFGGTAMLFYGYKEETKDVDLVFEKEEGRKEFIKAIEEIGYRLWTPFDIYVPEKLRDKYKPMVFKFGDGRFDLFIKKIFRTLISPSMKEDLFAVHDFKDKHNLRVKALRKEHIVLLKAVTERKNDFEDIRTIVEKEKNFDWQYFIDEVIWQTMHGDSWVLFDAEKMLGELKKYVFVEQKYINQLYQVEKEENKEKLAKKKK